MNEELQVVKLSGFVIVDSKALQTLINFANMYDVGEVVVRNLEGSNPRALTVDELENFNEYVKAQNPEPSEEEPQNVTEHV